MGSFKTVAGTFMVVVLGASILSGPGRASAASTCGSSNGFVVCLTVPDGPLSGEQTITATVTNPTKSIKSLLFTWPSTSTRLLQDFEALPDQPGAYSFVWPTTKYVDYVGVLSVQVVTSGPGEAVSQPLTLLNDNTTGI